VFCILNAHWFQDGRPVSLPVGLPLLRIPGFWLHTTLYGKPLGGEVACVAGLDFRGGRFDRATVDGLHSGILNGMQFVPAKA
jgi:hypothetical protein